MHWACAMWQAAQATGHMAMSPQSHFFVFTEGTMKDKSRVVCDRYQGGEPAVNEGAMGGPLWGGDWGWDPRMQSSAESGSMVQAEEGQGSSMAEGWGVGRTSRFQDRRLVLVLLIFHLIQEINPATLGDVKQGFKVLVLKSCYYNVVCFNA